MEERKYNIRRYFELGEVARYFPRIFSRNNNGAKPNFNLRIMHGINRIAIVMFLVAIIVLIIRHIIY